MRTSPGDEGPTPGDSDEHRRILELNAEGLRLYLSDGKGSPEGKRLAIARLMGMRGWSANPMFWIILGVGYVAITVVVIVFWAWFRPFAPANPKAAAKASPQIVVVHCPFASTSAN